MSYMNDVLRQYYLTQLGIDVYALKTIKHVKKKSVKFMIVGEALNESAAKLFNAIMLSMGVLQDDVYIATLQDTQRHCVVPECLIILGEQAAQTILKTTQSLNVLREKWHKSGDIPVRVSYHPAYLLKNPSYKANAYKDWIEIKRA